MQWIPLFKTYRVQDISDIEISDAIEDVTDDIKDVVGDIQDVSDAGLDVSDISDCGKTDSRHLWSKSFGGSKDDVVTSIAVDSSGNVYITGSFESSTIDFGGSALTNMNAPDYSDIFTVRFDSNGNYKWGKRFGGSSADEGYSVSADSFGNLYATGYFQGTNIDFGGCPLSYVGDLDIYLIKYAP